MFLLGWQARISGTGSDIGFSDAIKYSQTPQLSPGRRKQDETGFQNEKPTI